MAMHAHIFGHATEVRVADITVWHRVLSDNAYRPGVPLHARRPLEVNRVADVQPPKKPYELVESDFHRTGIGNLRGCV
jgi:hypothetical protein